MLLNTALIICREKKTDDQLREIMTTQPWAGTIHGFYNATTRGDHLDEWQYQCCFGHLPDSVYVEGGVGMARINWLDRSFDQPTPILLCGPLPDDPIKDWAAQRKIEQAWWHATVNFVLKNIGECCRYYEIEYGSIEDEAPNEVENAWKELILRNYNYDPEVVAEFETTTT
jgi:hypothetical protein